jgi:hypothetical protein
VKPVTRSRLYGRERSSAREAGYAESVARKADHVIGGSCCVRETRSRRCSRPRASGTNCSRNGYPKDDRAPENEVQPARGRRRLQGTPRNGGAHSAIQRLPHRSTRSDVPGANASRASDGIVWRLRSRRRGSSASHCEQCPRARWAEGAVIPRDAEELLPKRKAREASVGSRDPSLNSVQKATAASRVVIYGYAVYRQLRWNTVAQKTQVFEQEIALH